LKISLDLVKGTSLELKNNKSCKEGFLHFFTIVLGKTAQNNFEVKIIKQTV